MIKEGSLVRIDEENVKIFIEYMLPVIVEKDTITEEGVYGIVIEERYLTLDIAIGSEILKCDTSVCTFIKQLPIEYLLTHSNPQVREMAIRRAKMLAELEEICSS